MKKVVIKTEVLLDGVSRGLLRLPRVESQGTFLVLTRKSWFIISKIEMILFSIMNNV